MTDSAHDQSPRLGGQSRDDGREPALTGDRALLHALEMLNATDEQTRLGAVTALRDLGGKDAFEHLLRILYDETQMRAVRNRAAWALTRFGRPALPHFVRMAHSDDRETWDTGLWALELVAEDPELSRRAIRVLLDIMEHDSTIKRFMAAGRIKQMVKFHEPRGVYPALIRALDDEDIGVRLNVLMALRDLKDRRAVSKLRALLHVENFDVRRGAVEALGSIGDPRATPDIIAVLEGDDEFAWDGAALALGRIGDPRAIPALVKTARDPEKEIDLRRLCIECLNYIDSSKTIEELVAVLRDMSIPGEVRFRCCEGLARVGDAMVYAVLVDAIRDADLKVRGNAIYAIGRLARRIGVKTVPRSAIDAVIACVPDTRVVYEGVPPYTEDTTIQSQSVDALRDIGTPEVALALEEWRRGHPTK